MTRRRRGPAGLSRRGFLIGSGAALAGTAGVAAYRSARQPDAGAVRAQSRDELSTWAGVRDAFRFSDDAIHLSALLIAAHPRPVREAIAKHRDGLDRNPARYVTSNNRRLTNQTLAAAATYLGAEADQIALTDSTTGGLGLVYNGLRLRPGQEILTTEHDYFVTHESARLAAARTGATTRRIALYDSLDAVSADELAERAVGALRPHTRVLGLTWVHSSTGLKLPVAAIAERLATINERRDDDDRVLLVLDAVHGFGVEDITVGELGVDVFVAGCHKWLFGPRGTGIVWARPQAWAAMRPIVPSFMESDVHGAWLEGEAPDGPTTAAMMSPGGFKAFEHRWALAEAFEFQRAIGKERVAARTNALARRLKEGLAELPRVTVRTPMSQDLSAGIVSFDLDGLGPWQVTSRLRSAGILASVAPYESRHVRLTPCIANTPEEIDRAVAAVGDLR